MDEFHYPQFRNHQTKHRKRLTQDQVRILESNFTSNKKLDPDRKSQLALALGVPPRQVAVWYQNKRARDKYQSLEADHRALHMQLENVLAENARLRGEVERLEAELSQIQGTLRSSSSCGGAGRSGLATQQSGERELYGCLGGTYVARDGYDFFGYSIS